MKKVFISLLLLSLFLVSCKDEDYNLNLGFDECEVEMAFNTIIDSNTILQVSDEAIVELDLLVFKNNEFEYYRSAYAADEAKFRSILQMGTNLDIYFLANCRSVLREEPLVKGMSWETVQSKLIFAYRDTIIGEQAVLPMWGRLKDVEISDNVVNNLGRVDLLRAVASANIIFQNVEGRPFVPYVAYIYYGADRTFVAPPDEVLDFSSDSRLLGVTEPLSPEGMLTDKVEEFMAENGEFPTLYMLENATLNNENGNRRTRLVIGGYLDNNTDDLTYYPLIFIAGNEVLRVTRNNQYNLYIKSINDEGYSDPDEAAEGSPVNMDYEVVTWNENNHNNIIIDGADYLSISNKCAYLYSNTGSKTTVRLSGTYKKENFSFNLTNSLNGTSVVNGSTVKNDRFYVELTGAGTNLVFTIEALADYSQINSLTNLDVLTVQVGRLKFDLEIEQLSPDGWKDGGNKDIIFY